MTKTDDRVEVTRAIRRQSWVLALVLMVLGVARAWAWDERERWYAIELAGQPAGWMASSQSREGDTIRTTTRMRLEIRRGQAAVVMETSSTTREREDGTPLDIESEMRLGTAPVRQRVRFEGGKAMITSLQGGQELTQEVALNGEWHMPAAAERIVRERMERREDPITVRTVDATTGFQIVEVTRRGFAEVKIEVDGKEMEAIRSVSTTSAMPGLETIEFCDAEGVPLRVETTMLGIRMVMTATTRERALGIRAGDMPELMVRTFVKPDRAIAGSRSTTRAVYVISAEEGPAPLPPTQGPQRAVRLPDGRVRVEIDVTSPAPAPAEEVSDPSYLAGSTMVNIEDEEIRRLLGVAVRDAGREPGARAEACRAFVNRFIRKKNLSVGFATASEAARTREGDCTEHAVLLAALLRADGIPARVVSGLVYADQFAGEREIFGYHMWTQALLSGSDGVARWVDLDAALRSDRPTDATHIALSVSSLGEGHLQESFAGLAAIMGQLRINVEMAE
jgi:transglutaminase-like putative cysteine protease